jgi:hypothetical protein
MILFQGGIAKQYPKLLRFSGSVKQEQYVSERTYNFAQEILFKLTRCNQPGLTKSIENATTGF